MFRLSVYPWFWLNRCDLTFLGSSWGGTPLGPGGRYSIYKDKSRGAVWEWFKQEIVVKCDDGNKPQAAAIHVLNLKELS